MFWHFVYRVVPFSCGVRGRIGTSGPNSHALAMVSASWSSGACFVDRFVAGCESEVLLDYKCEIMGGFVVERILVECGVNEFVILK
jgi:hypothetical protein